MSSKPSIPKGLQIRRAGTSIETVYSAHGEIQLRLTEPGAELVEFSLRAGDWLTLVPPTDADTPIPPRDGLKRPNTEIYYRL